MMVVLILFFFGGDVIHDFTIALIVGLVTGNVLNGLHREPGCPLSGSNMREKEKEKVIRGSLDISAECILNLGVILG